jgi:hypothetical protein
VIQWIAPVFFCILAPIYSALFLTRVHCSSGAGADLGGPAHGDAERRILGLDYDAGDHGAVRALDPPVILFLELFAALRFIPGTFRCSAGRR